jgi:hypothetical protein
MMPAYLSLQYDISIGISHAFFFVPQRIFCASLCEMWDDATTRHNTSQHVTLQLKEIFAKESLQSWTDEYSEFEFLFALCVTFVFFFSLPTPGITTSQLTTTAKPGKIRKSPQKGEKRNPKKYWIIRRRFKWFDDSSDGDDILLFLNLFEKRVEPTFSPSL